MADTYKLGLVPRHSEALTAFLAMLDLCAYWQTCWWISELNHFSTPVAGQQGPA